MVEQGLAPGEFDPFREQYPAHEPQSVGEILDPFRPRDEGDEPDPEPKQVRCAICHKLVMKHAVWFNQKWVFPSVCLNCADDNRIPVDFLSECQRPPVRQVSCLSCGISRGVDPVLKHNQWHYELICSNCGTHSIRLYRLKRLCASCNQEMVVDDRRPNRLCPKCRTSNSKPY